MSEISAAANRLIKQHGETAPYVAAQRASERQEAGDHDGQMHWKNVLIETKVLLARDNCC